MNKDQRTHNREKRVGSGSIHVGKGNRVGSNGPVGFGGRGEGGSGERGTSATGGLPIKLNLKTILIIAVVVIIAAVFLNKTGLLGALPISGGEGNIISGNADIDGDASYTKADTSVSPDARGKYVSLKGGGEDTVTIMVYMCGTDLESKYGMATADLNEMMKADLSDKINLIICTGGCSKWNNNKVSNSRNQIFRVQGNDLVKIEDDFGNLTMTEPENLTRFIKYCDSKFKADRNMLIFWDHGGGSVSGYGYDETDPRASSMTLTMINSALKDAGVKFDAIGFDACLMATLETALVCNNYADYLIASEETEPGTGWYYTGWLNKLSDNTSEKTVYIAQKIIDDFVAASCSASSGAKVTLSVVDLAELQGTVPEALSDFASSTGKLISGDEYKTVASARAGARQFAQSSKINQVDLIDLANRIGTDDASDLAKVLKGSIKYNKTTISRSNGLSIYFPYETTKTVGNAVSTMNTIGSDNEYTECMRDYSDCIKAFASLEYGGQIAASASQTQSGGMNMSTLLGSLISSYSGSSTSPLDTLMGAFTGSGGSSSAGYGLDASTIMSLLSAFSGRSMPAEYEWVDTDLISSNAKKIADNFVDPARITVSRKDGRKVLSLTDEEWALIDTVELNVFVGDGDGYIDLGLDNTFDWLNDDMTDLLLEYDGTWLCINGEYVCAYYLVSDTKGSDGKWTTVGRIPVRLNGEYVNLQVVFKEGEDAVITGAYPMYEDGNVSVMAKGNVEIKTGDSIEFLCDYYDLDGKYSATYTLGEKMTVPRSGLRLENIGIDNTDVDAMYRLTDVYGNHFWIAAD